MRFESKCWNIPNGLRMGGTAVPGRFMGESRATEAITVLEDLLDIVLQQTCRKLH